jgi:hypothetical protein
VTSQFSLSQPLHMELVREFFVLWGKCTPYKCTRALLTSTSHCTVNSTELQSVLES